MKHIVVTLVTLVVAFGGITSSVQAVDPDVQALVNEGNGFLDEGDIPNAEISFTNAKGLAVDSRDWDGMLLLADRFLTIGSEYHGKDSFLIASQIAHEIADRSAQLLDQNMCDDAVNTLSRVAMAWETGLIDIPMAEDTMSQMQGMSDIAGQNADYYEEHGCF